MPATLHFHGARACSFAPPAHPGAAARIFPRHLGHLSVGGALEALSPKSTISSARGSVSVWIHDRRARRARLVGVLRSRAYAAAGDARADRVRQRFRLAGCGSTARSSARRRRLTARLVAPLRGWRRALGTLVIEGEPPRPRPIEQFVDARSRLRARSSRSRSKTCSCSRKCCSSAACSRTRSTRSSISSSSSTARCGSCR